MIRKKKLTIRGERVSYTKELPQMMRIINHTMTVSMMRMKNGVYKMNSQRIAPRARKRMKIAHKLAHR
jgi:hypothetical protein